MADRSQKQVRLPAVGRQAGEKFEQARRRGDLMGKSLVNRGSAPRLLRREDAVAVGDAG